jgi:hypothetical protein
MMIYSQELRRLKKNLNRLECGRLSRLRFGAHDEGSYFEERKARLRRMIHAIEYCNGRSRAGGGFFSWLHNLKPIRQVEILEFKPIKEARRPGLGERMKKSFTRLFSRQGSR